MSFYIVDILFEGNFVGVPVLEEQYNKQTFAKNGNIGKYFRPLQSTSDNAIKNMKHSSFIIICLFILLIWKIGPKNFCHVRLVMNVHVLCKLHCPFNNFVDVYLLAKGRR